MFLVLENNENVRILDWLQRDYLSILIVACDVWGPIHDIEDCLIWHGQTHLFFCAIPHSLKSMKGL